MEDSLDQDFSDSSTTEDFEIITSVLSPPVIENSGINLEDLLSEAITDSSTVQKDTDFTIEREKNITRNAPEGLDLYQLIDECDSAKMEQEQLDRKPSLQDDIVDDRESYRLVGAGSKFYKPIESVETHPLQQISPVESLPTPTEKQDDMKPSESDDEVSDLQQHCTVFDGVSYLGAATINSPKSETDIQRIMGTLSAQRESKTGIAVSISVPICSDGMVVLYDAATNSVMARYAVKRISYYARGAVNTTVASCFAFTWSHGETREVAVYQCHVFRCHIAEAVDQVSSCFVKAFERVPRSMTSSIIGGDMSRSMTSSVDGASMISVQPMPLMHVLECTVEIKEYDQKGTFVHVPKERLGFKIRGSVDKQVNVSVKQVRNNSEDPDDAQDSYNGRLIIDRCFGILLAPGRNVVHSDMRLLEMMGGSTDDSLGYNAEAMWYASDQALAGFNVAGENGPKHMTIGLDLVIRGIPDPLRLIIETPVKVYPATEKFWYFSKRPLVQQFFVNLKETTDKQGVLHYVISGVDSSGELDRSRLSLALANLLPSPATQPPPSPPAAPDSDNDEPMLSGTGEVSKECGDGVLENWGQVLRSWNGGRPKALNHLVRLGVPESLRCDVWQRLAETEKIQDLMEQYRLLIAKECECEGVIQRDIARTFPAHESFKEVGGLGQDSLLRLTRAYAVYDTEVGYCQGLSFLAATLLLHMPEEQAFCVLVRLMYDYGLRNLYKDGFEHLYMRLHQLDRLMEDQLSDLHQHFRDTGVEPHMFASQWLLTLYTARFPLPLVFHIVDVFLLQGIDTLFQVAISLLSKARKDLLLLDFEGILKYFRVTLPKRCRAEEVARKIIKNACAVKVKRLPKYQAEFEAFTKEAAQKEINVEMDRLKSLNTQLLEEKEQLESQLQEAWMASNAAFKESARSAAVANDYKQICARQDRQLHQMQDVVKDCLACTSKLSPSSENKVDESKWEKCGEEDVESQTKKRVRDLELELAQVKLELVQAMCNNQELTHQISTMMSDYQGLLNKKPSWSPWLAKTLGSLKEAAQNTRPTFQTYLPNLSVSENLSDKSEEADKSLSSPVEFRRVSVPYKSSVAKTTVTTEKRHSMDNARKSDKNVENRRSYSVSAESSH